MPYTVSKDESACSASKPWAVKKKSDGKVMGCHETEEDAKKQQAALYANEADASAKAAVDAFLADRAKQLVKGATASDSEAPTVSLTKIEHVALFEVGMNWHASTGDMTFDFPDVESAALQSKDPTMPRPRIKLGHSDPRFNNQYVYDAMPNFGFVENITGEGAVAFGDLVDIPVWLATIMPVAYPSRSVEGWQNVSSKAGKEYSFLMTDIALLGVVWPGVWSLDDLPNMYGEEIPSNVTIQAA